MTARCTFGRILNASNPVPGSYLRGPCFTTCADRVLRMIESEMPQLKVVAEPGLSAQQAIGLPESNSNLKAKERAN